MPRRIDDDCRQELRWLYDRRDLPEARRDLAACLTKWSGKYPKLTGWIEENIDESLTFYRLGRQHHKHLKSINMLERLNEEIKRANTRRSRCAVRPDPRPIQPSTVHALSRAQCGGGAGAAAFAAASSTAAVRGALPMGRSGRRDARVRSNKGMLRLP